MSVLCQEFEKIGPNNSYVLTVGYIKPVCGLVSKQDVNYQSQVICAFRRFWTRRYSMLQRNPTFYITGWKHTYYLLVVVRSVYVGFANNKNSENE